MSNILPNPTQDIRSVHPHVCIKAFLRLSRHLLSNSQSKLVLRVHTNQNGNGRTCQELRDCVWALGWGEGVCLCVESVFKHVSQNGRKALPANSLHSSVSERPTHISRLHGRKHNLFDATLPTCLKSYRQTPALLTFWLSSHIPCRRAGKRTPYTRKSLFKVKDENKHKRLNSRLLTFTPEWCVRANMRNDEVKSHFTCKTCKWITCTFVCRNTDR